MLKEFELSLDILNDVLDAHTPFSEALRKRFQTNVDIRPYRGLVAGLVGCELRHQIYFDFMTKGLKGFGPAERRMLSLVLANAYFFRRFDVDETHKALEEMIGSEKMAKCQDLFDLASTPENYIPASVDRKSPLYLSLRFNVPEWTVKVISHYGGSNAYQSLRKFSRPATTTLRVRTSEIALSSVYENLDYSASPINGIVFYKGNTPLRKIEEFRKGQLFQEKLLTKQIVDEHPVSEPGQVLVYDGNADSSLEREVIETYGDKIGMNIAVPNIDEKVEVSKLIKAKKLRNVNFFSAADPSFMDAAVSAPQKLVIAAPNSSNFDLIPTAPDYLLHFDLAKLDEIIAQEKAVLEGCSKYVDDGGTLLYVVYTIARKEGHQIVAEFLKAHPEFTLVSERQHFPHEELETAAYVAELLKGEKELTIPAPLADLATLANSTPTTSVNPTASGK